MVARPELELGGREDLGLGATDVAAKSDHIRRRGTKQVMSLQPELSYVS